MRLAIALLAFCLVASAQRHKLTVNTETPEGQLLQQIGQENDAAKKLALMEDFAGKFAKHESAAWVFSQMQTAYLKANDFQKAIDAGDRIIAVDPEDVETAHQNLKAAEGLKNADAIVKWSNTTSAAARKVVASPQPADKDEVEAWKTRVDYAKQVDTYTEYALYAAAVQIPDPKQRILITEELGKRQPQSQYLVQVMPIQFIAYRQLNDNDGAMRAAERGLSLDQNNEDMLIFTANRYLETKAFDRAAATGQKAADVINAKAAPQGVSEADWAKKKLLIAATGNWIAGRALFQQNKFAPADKALRGALAGFEGNDQMLADTLFHLGLSNYKMEKIQDALKFNERCAAIKSPFQAQAIKNVKAIKGQYTIK